MRIFDIDNSLPQRHDGIDWKKCSGLYVRFVYDDIDDYLYIKEATNNLNIICVYKGVEYPMRASSLRKCKLSFLVGKRSRNYLYKIGEIINNHEVVEQNKYRTKRAYDLRCLKCNYIRKNVTEDKIRSKCECPVCTNRICVEGVNDIATTHPQYSVWLKDPNDAKQYTMGSRYVLEGVCPDCGNTVKFKPQNLMKSKYLNCNCRDNISMPNKFCFNVLKQLGVEFESEYCPVWMHAKRYDFYVKLKKNEFLIEMDGAQHKRETGLRGLEKNIEVDLYKNMMAEKNGVKLIRIDCEKSNFEFIKQNMLDSELSTLLDLSMINWDEVERYCVKNLCKEVCDLWNTGDFKTQSELREHTGYSKPTIEKSLKIGRKFGWIK